MRFVCFKAGHEKCVFFVDVVAYIIPTTLQWQVIFEEKLRFGTTETLYYYHQAYNMIRDVTWKISIFPSAEISGNFWDHYSTMEKCLLWWKRLQRIHKFVFYLFWIVDNATANKMYQYDNNAQKKRIFSINQ